MQYYKNAKIFLADRGFQHGGFATEDGRFAEVYTGEGPAEAVNLEGLTVLPGLVDQHTHGNSGADFSDGDYEGLVRMGRFLARQGVTTFAPTSMTLPYETLKRAFQNAAQLREELPEDCAAVQGINMEGPFLSEKKKGAQNGAYLRLPDWDAFTELNDACGGLIRLVDLAPELEGAVAFTERASKLCTVSVAHTDADYEEAVAIFAAGARNVTHLYNAMPGIHHRKPGVIGAASENAEVYAELICDGHHIHPSAVRMAFRLFPGRICLISDAMRSCGMPDGPYTLGGQDVVLKNGVVRLADGTIAGSAATLWQCLQNAVRFGIPKEEAILSCTLNPARQLGCADRVGSISVGKQADFVLCDDELNLLRVCLRGHMLEEGGTSPASV